MFLIRRVAKKFDIRLNTLEAATLDILFSKQKETRAIHMNISQGSFFDLSIPWVLESEEGYTSKIIGTLMNPEATTSLAYRDFIQCETLEFQLDLVYPKFWNDHQEWNFTFTVSKATVNFIFAHKWFFQVKIGCDDNFLIFTKNWFAGHGGGLGQSVTSRHHVLHPLHLEVQVHFQRVRVVDCSQ